MNIKNINCNVCNNTDLSSNDGRASLCCKCSVLLNLSAGEINYSENAGQNVPDALKHRQRQMNAELRFKLLEPLIKKPTFFIDIGCGSGEMLEESAKFCENHLGFEKNNALVQYLRKKGLSIQQSDFNAQSFKINHGTAIWQKIFSLSHVIEHIKKPIDLLMSVENCMSSGDVLYIEVPLYTGKSFSRYGYNWRLWYPEHYNLYSLETLMFLAEKLKLKVSAKGNRVFASNNLSIIDMLKIFFFTPMIIAVAIKRRSQGIRLPDLYYKDFGYTILAK